ncbi:hypothetical protein VKT23_013462 [Stygiomarasmius scandens]|uniref:Uncharacterized protein n=1 Tax=Marasmiellus scandens TaxID=2682957 RepID=A0ABR1J3K0_9AGAR
MPMSFTGTPQLSLAERIAQKVQSAAHFPTSDPASPTTPVQNQDDELPPLISTSPGPGPDTLHSIPTRNHVALTAFARQLKDDYDLDHNSCAEVDRYCATSSLEERLLLHFVSGVKQREMLKKKFGSEQYIIPGTLKATLRANAFLLLLSPKLTCYHGKLANAVINATREIGCHELPAVHDTGKLQVIEKDLKKHFADLRYTLKDKIRTSLSRKKKRDIASLTVDIIGDKRSLSPTLALFRRVALLRAYVSEKKKDLKPEDRKKDFWARVDEGIQKWRGMVNGNADKLLEFFEATYREDVAKYGDPAKSGVVTIKMSEVPSHQQIIDNHAAKVQYVGSDDDDDDGDSRPRKRQRVEDPDESDEGDGSFQALQAEGNGAASTPTSP